MKNFTTRIEGDKLIIEANLTQVQGLTRRSSAMIATTGNWVTVTEIDLGGELHEIGFKGVVIGRRKRSNAA